MAEDDLMPFDPTMKKKKKKKKTPFDSDAINTDDPISDGAPSKSEPTQDEKETVSEPKVDLDDDLSLDFQQLKKKKKKKKAFDLDDIGDALPDTADTVEKENDMDAEDNADDLGTEELNLQLPARKKKKKKIKFEDLDTQKDDEEEEEDGTDGTNEKSWIGSDRDYTYDELLNRVFDIIREKNPDMVAGEKKRFVMRPPQVLKVGTRKSAFANFAEICRLLHRQPKHVLAFLLAELGTSGSVDGNNQLIIRGKYNQKQIENVIRKYIKEYVTCHTCRSPDTVLQKDTRLYFLQCETCGSRCSVATIKTGFQAVTSKQVRQAIRAKNA